MDADILPLLAQVDIFRELPHTALGRLVEQGHRRTFRAGSRLMRQGEVAVSLHVILRGRVRVERSHPSFKAPVALVECGPGDVVGELGVLDGESRRESAVAITATETLELAASVLATTLLQVPEAGATLVPVFSRRLHTTDDLAQQEQRRADQASEHEVHR